MASRVLVLRALALWQVRVPEFGPIVKGIDPDLGQDRVEDADLTDFGCSAMRLTGIEKVTRLVPVVER